MIKFEFFLAFRYLRAKRKQTMVSVISAISVLGIAAGVMALVIALALSTGFLEIIQTKILGTTSAINLMRSDSSPLLNYDKLLDEIGPIPQITGSAPAIFKEVLIRNNNRKQFAALKGVIPPREKNVSDFFSHIIEGDPNSLDERTLSDTGSPASLENIMIGKEMALSLGVILGDTIKVQNEVVRLTPLGMKSLVKTKTLRIGAIFDTGLWDIDANWVYVNIDTARNLFNYPPGSTSAIQFKTDDLEGVAPIAEDIRAKAGDDFYTTTWIESNRTLFSSLKLEKILLFLTIGLIVLVAALNIVTSLIMMVMDKQGDISILAAMGATPQTIQKAFMLQGLIIGIVGTIIGDILGVGISWLLNHYKLIKLDAEIYSIPYVPFHLHAWDVLLVSATAILISYLATLYPSRRAAGLDPVEVLRYE